MSSSLASSSQPLYDEVIAPSGFRVGETKSVIVRKVIPAAGRAGRGHDPVGVVISCDFLELVGVAIASGDSKSE